MVETKNALLILVGGRQTTNVLTAVHLRPDVIVPLASQEALQEGDAWSQVKDSLAQICPAGVEEPVPIDAFDIEQVRQECRAAVARNNDAQWYFNLTCASKIMGFGALEVAKECHASAWYLDTITRRVVTLVGDPPKSDLFQLTVEKYLSGYGRRCVESDEPSEKLFVFAKQLAQRPMEAMRFRDSLRNSGFNSVGRNQTKTVRFNSQARFVSTICEQAKIAGLIKAFTQSNGYFEITVVGNDLYCFLDGEWLEIYVYAKACEANCFDNKKLNIMIPGVSGTNNLDLAATHSASLIIAECKTEKEFKTEHLDKLNSIANLVGGNYVGRIFITSKEINPYNSSEKRSFDDFCGQAKTRRVVVISGKKLKDLDQIFQEEVKNPTYPRE